MENSTKIKQYIHQIAPKPFETVRLATVQSVQGDTCTILLDGLEIPGVSLRPIQNQNTNPFRITPAQGAHVIVADLSSGNLRTLSVIAVSEAQKIEINSPTQSDSNSPTNHPTPHQPITHSPPKGTSRLKSHHISFARI